MSSELHIIAPGICGPLAETESIKNNVVLKRWVKTLARAEAFPDFSSVNAVTASLFEINMEVDFPSAALTLLANNGYYENRYYMHADPVHLRAELDHAVLTPSHDLAFTEEEAEVLCDAINAHFNQDGLSFFRLDANRWFVSSKEKIQLTTTPLNEAIGRNVNFILPEGENAIQWKQLLTESQMLLHNHAVNTTRESTGQQIINSLWLYGAGELPVVNADITSICSNEDMFKGLAQSINSELIEMPNKVEDYLQHLGQHLQQHASSAINVLHISELEQLTNYTDVSMWLERLQQVLQQWLYPLIAYCNKNNIRLVLHPCAGTQYQFTKYDGLKFWRKAAVEAYVSHY